MEVRSIYATSEANRGHRQHGRHVGTSSLHWLAVVALVICQFTIIPMLVMIAADTHLPVDHRTPSELGPSITNMTTIFESIQPPKP